MSTTPLPPSPLGQHCSALRKNTLYTFSAAGFQSLSLSADSEWTELPPGIPTTGGECVLANRGKKDEALYVIGGSTNEETADTFSGLQRYVFETKKWETITLSDPVAFNLTNHGATYIEDSGQLIIFAGTAWPIPVDTPSANTYLISTKAPYQITSVVADTPLLKPIVLPWGSSGAVIIGGDEGNRNLNTYTPGKDWKALDKQLEKGIPARGEGGASFIDGDDGTRWLIMFDFTTSPASVLEPKIIDPSSSSGKLARRQNAELTGENWPDYDTKLAPTGKRTDTSLAADGDMIVISGGDDEAPLLLFNARENSWMDPQDIFSLASTDDDKFTTTSETTTSSTLPSPSSDDATETLTPIAGSPATGGGLNTVQILLVVLGSIIALGLILTSLFFFLRRSRRTPPPPSDKYTQKHHLSFQDRGVSFMKEAGGGPPLDLHPARHMDPHEPHPGSPVLTTPVAAARGSGWSRYFSGNNSATNLVPYPATVRSTYTDFTAAKSTPHTSHHPNPYLYGAGPGVVAGGGRRGSDISMSDIGRDSFSSGIPSEHEGVKTPTPWSPVEPRHESSLYPPESEGIPSRRETMDRSSSRYSGPPDGTADNLSWLNLRTG